MTYLNKLLILVKNLENIFKIQIQEMVIFKKIFEYYLIIFYDIPKKNRRYYTCRKKRLRLAGMLYWKVMTNHFFHSNDGVR